VINASFIGGLAVPFGLAVVSVVPEPSAWPMIAVGGVALLGIMLRRKHGIVS
jgi:PEP-CTERM motif